MQLPKRYGIGELAELLKISKTTLIYWADQGYVPKPRRSDTLSRGRWWTEEDANAIYEYRQMHYQR